VNARVLTVHGVYEVDLEEEEVIGLVEAPFERAPRPEVSLPRVLDAAASGATVVAVVASRPPLVVSRDAGTTWSETGRGLPEGRAVAISADEPDLVLFAARNRLYLSRDGGRFWHALALELPEISAVRFTEA
jgi:hypothetical protein